LESFRISKETITFLLLKILLLPFLNLQTSMESKKDKELWKMAKKRAGFQRHLMAYLVINAFLWALWAIGGADGERGHPWPMWCTIGWGLGVVFAYFSAYGGDADILAQREYERLKKKHGQ
jgi:nitrate reductase NapE component